MVVWKTHSTEPTAEVVEHMLGCLSLAAETRFGETEFHLDTNMRQIPDHWHAHARDSDWFAQRMQRPMSRFTGVGSDRVERPLP